MFDQVTIRVGDRPASERFYRTSLATLGLEPDRDDDAVIAWDDFALSTADGEHPPTRHLHIAFLAPSRDRIDEFWRAGTEAGYEDAGAPGERPQYTPNYYGAFLRDPDGNSAEAVRHDYVSHGATVDHIWIRVGDLEAATAFYAAIAPHAGLRPGRRWEQGRQLRGKRSTLSLVGDGGPVTEGLELAFPAPDRQAVEAFHRAAVAAGGGNLREPGDSSRGYSASVLDPDGARVEFVHRG